MAMDPGRGGANPQNQMRDLPPEFSATLLAQLTAAKTGEKTFNRSRTLVQIEYIIKPAEHIPPKSAQKDCPPQAAKPPSEVSGLGGNLTEVLASAIKLLEEDKIERFVRAMYPIPELAGQTNLIETQRFLFRFSSNPEMKVAMIRDLTLLQQMKPQQTGNVSVFTLPPLVKGDEERTVKFELVGTNWRFIDSAAETRQTHLELMKTPVSGYTIPRIAGVLIVQRHPDDECWKLVTWPAIVPVGGNERIELTEASCNAISTDKAVHPQTVFKDTNSFTSFFLKDRQS